VATSITQFAAGDFGGAGADPQLSVGIGGTAAADDWLQVTTCGIDGGGDQPTVITDNVGGAWDLLFDYTDAEGWRTLGWAKKALGGETTVTATWPSSSNRAMVGFWAGTPSLPELYLIASGPMTFTGAHMSFFGTGSILTSGSSYVGGMASGRGPITNANFGNSPAVPAQGGDGSVLSGACKTIAHYNIDEGSHTTADVLEYIVEPMQAAYSFWIGFTDEPEPVEIIPAGKILLGGEVEVTAMGGDALVVPAGGFLGGEIDLDITGGEIDVAGTGRFLGGRVTVTAPDPSPPVPETHATNLLGCGEYDVYAFTRGGGFILGSLEFDQIDWGRKLDATSAATLTINGQSNVGALQRCCQLLGEIEPWEHELGIYRSIPGSNQKKRVWSGPVTRLRFPSEQCIIEAFDLSQWLVVRTLHANHNYVATDLIQMWVGWVEDAMGVENSAGLFPTVRALAGQLGDRLTTIVEHDYAADVIAEIATTGIDWTCIDRVMSAGPVLAQPPGIPGSGTEFPLLIDESFRVAPEIIVDGMAGGNCWFVNGGGVVSGVPIFGEYGPAFASTPDHVAQPAAPDYQEIEDQFGRIETTVSETKILDQSSIDQAARTRYDLTKRPMPYITGGELLPSAPLPIDKIIPGLLVQVHLQRACKPIAATMRMNQLDVSAQNDGSESVNLGLEPIGTTA
jgi:hypothetical protein